MRLVPRAAAAVLVVGVALAGCGGSVADSDTPAGPRSAAPRASPFCAAVQANSEAIRPLSGLAGGDEPPADLAATVQAVRITGGNLINTAPRELRGDVQRTVDAVTLQLDALTAAGGDAAAAGRDPRLAALNSPELAAASRRVSNYVTENCDAAAR